MIVVAALSSRFKILLGEKKRGFGMGMWVISQKEAASTDSSVSMATEVNLIQGKQWMNALDANYSSAIHAPAIVSS
jgi:hypothetical protein